MTPRTAASAATGVLKQAEQLPGFALTSRTDASLGGRPAVTLAWTYTARGQRTTRRHWVIELPDSVVHVSCVGDATGIPSECDAVAKSVQAKRS